MNATPFTGLGRRAYNRVSDSYSPFEVPVPQFRGVSKVQTMRDALRAHGRLTARQLATMADLESTALVGGLLKNDLGHGRVKFDGAAYCWNDGFDERLQEAITDAVALLRRNGWRVEKPR